MMLELEVCAICNSFFEFEKDVPVPSIAGENQEGTFVPRADASFKTICKGCAYKINSVRRSKGEAEPFCLECYGRQNLSLDAISEMVTDIIAPKLHAWGLDYSNYQIFHSQFIFGVTGQMGWDMVIEKFGVDIKKITTLLYQRTALNALPSGSVN